MLNRGSLPKPQERCDDLLPQKQDQKIQYLEGQLEITNKKLQEQLNINNKLQEKNVSFKSIIFLQDFKFLMCEKTVQFKSTLQRHIKAIHTFNKRKFHCDECEVQYSNCSEALIGLKNIKISITTLETNTITNKYDTNKT